MMYGIPTCITVHDFCGDFQAIRVEEYGNSATKHCSIQDDRKGFSAWARSHKANLEACRAEVTLHFEGYILPLKCINLYSVIVIY